MFHHLKYQLLMIVKYGGNAVMDTIGAAQCTADRLEMDALIVRDVCHFAGILFHRINISENKAKAAVQKWRVVFLLNLIKHAERPKRITDEEVSQNRSI